MSKTYKDFINEAAKFKVGDQVKISKKGHDWDGKTGTVNKSKMKDRTQRDTFSVSIEGSLQSDSFSGGELTKV